MRKKYQITDAVGGAAFSVKVITRARRAEIVGIQEGGMLKVRLTASPTDNDAVNAELVAFLAERLGVSTTAVNIVAGLTGREKLISVDGIRPSDLDDRLVPDKPA